jgi:hypothetical protein
MFWKSPWTGDLLPKVTPETPLTDRNRVRSFPSFSALQPESPLLRQGSKSWSSPDDFVLMKNDNSLSRSGSYISRRLSRRSSNAQRPGLQPQPGKLALRETRREPVIHFGPSDIGNHDLHLSIESLTSEDRSPVEDSCVPLARRQSFRRPGIATRTLSWGLYRTPLSSIQQEDEKEHDTSSAPRPSWELPCEPEDQEEYTPVYSSNRRAASPVALDYSHLSGFKKGTLRIVNGSVSPACSDRIRLLTTASLASELPKSVYAKETNYHDKAIDVFDNNSYYKNHNASESRQPPETCENLVSEAIDFSRIEKAQSITNADSGYSSLSSVHSDDSSGQSRSPVDSPINGSPTQSEGGGPMDKEGYFYNRSNTENLHYYTINKPLMDRENDNFNGAHLVQHPIADRPRYYADLGPLSIPSVPEEIGIDGRESVSDSDNDQSDLDYLGQVITISQEAQDTPQIGNELLACREKLFDPPRGRTRSRSIRHAHSKLVKTKASV